MIDSSNTKLLAWRGSGSLAGAQDSWILCADGAARECHPGSAVSARPVGRTFGLPADGPDHRRLFDQSLPGRCPRSLRTRDQGVRLPCRVRSAMVVGVPRVELAPSRDVAVSRSCCGLMVTCPAGRIFTVAWESLKQSDALAAREVPTACRKAATVRKWLITSLRTRRTNKRNNSADLFGRHSGEERVGTRSPAHHLRLVRVRLTSVGARPR
jgi:hypothetical protein